MKNKFQRMSLEDKKKIEKTYNNTNKGKKESFYLKRLNITGIICIITGFIFLIVNIIQNVKWYEYLSVVSLIVAGIFFIYSSNRIKIKEYNKIAIKKNK